MVSTQRRTSPKPCNTKNLRCETFSWGLCGGGKRAWRGPQWRCPRWGARSWVQQQSRLWAWREPWPTMLKGPDCVAQMQILFSVLPIFFRQVPTMLHRCRFGFAYNSTVLRFQWSWVYWFTKCAWAPIPMSLSNALFELVIDDGVLQSFFIEIDEMT